MSSDTDQKRVNGRKFLNLLVYSDSLAFRRRNQPQDVIFTYPFVLRDLIEAEWGVRVNLFFRGRGDIKIAEIHQIVGGDSRYFSSDGEALNIAVLQFGIVDCAPQPATYLLAPLLRRIPRMGAGILAALVRHRRGLQIFCSYRPTSKRRFKREYAAIVRICANAKIRPVAVGLPLPTLAIERRSPGFRRSASQYNQLIQDVIPESFCDIERHMSESLRETFLMSDGHHLTEEGHRLYARTIFGQMEKLL